MDPGDVALSREETQACRNTREREVLLGSLSHTHPDKKPEKVLSRPGRGSLR